MIKGILTALLFAFTFHYASSQQSWQTAVTLPLKSWQYITVQTPGGNIDTSLTYCANTAADSANLHWFKFALCDTTSVECRVNFNQASTGIPHLTVWGPFSNLSESDSILPVTAPALCRSLLVGSSVMMTFMPPGVYYMMLAPGDSVTGAITINLSSLGGPLFEYCTLCETPVRMPGAICGVTSDSATQKIVLTLDQGDTTNVAGYRIYRENNIANQFDSLAFIPVSAPPVYTDVTANSGSRVWRYMASVISTCGDVIDSGYFTYPQRSVASIHLQQTLSTSGGIDLSWNNANPGGPFIQSYYIYRSNGVAAMQLYDSIPSSLTTYTDISPMPGINVYQVAMHYTNGASCGAVNGSFSNRSATVFTAVDEIDNSLFTLGPNPSDGMINLSVYASNNGYELTLFDDAGRLLQSFKGSGRGNAVISTDGYSTGYVIAQLTLNGKTYLRKLMIESK